MGIIHKIKTRWPMFLAAVIAAELLVLFIPSMDLNAYKMSGVSLYKWVYNYVGLVLFPLIGLTLLYLYIVFRLVQLYRADCDSSSAFGSTVFGISLSITAYLTHEMFKNFLLLPEKDADIPEEI